MKCQAVYESIRSYISNHDFKLENVYVHAWEADMFSVTASKYTYEIEVKISRSDFFCDLKKPKHQLFKTQNLNHKTSPNRFFFACPVGLVEVFEVPKYAGLIYVMDSGSYRMMKSAPFLHKDEFNHREMLFDKYFYKWNGLNFKNWELTQEIQRLKNELEYLKTENLKVIQQPEEQQQRL